MASYSTVMSPATSFTVFLGSKCLTCYALVQDADKWAHDNWHSSLLQGWVELTTANQRLESTESDQEMLRRLLREVMELSERIGDE